MRIATILPSSFLYYFLNFEKAMRKLRENIFDIDYSPVLSLRIFGVYLTVG